MKINEINNIAPQQIKKGSLNGIEKGNKGYSLSLHVNGQSDQFTVRIIDNQSKETVSETTSQELSEIHQQIYDMAGRLLDKKI